MAVANPPPLVPIAGASDREGRSRRNRHHWIAMSRGINHHPHLLLPDHRGAPGLQHRAFFRKSTVRQCNTAPGRRRERSGARARAVPMGQGVGRVWRPPAPRVECALPFSDEFWCFGPDKGPSIVFGQATRAAGAAAARVVEGVFLRCATPRPPISRMRARSRHTGVASMAAREADGRREQLRERAPAATRA